MQKPSEDIAPIVVTKFERLIVPDVAGNRALECDYAEGFFTRDPDFIFEVYFADEARDRVYKNTRIGEMYFKSGGCIQWSWGGPPLDEDPGWDHGKHLLADLLAGIDPAIETQVAGNAQYCVARFDSVVYQLLKLRIDPSLVVTAMAEVLDRHSAARS